MAGHRPSGKESLALENILESIEHKLLRRMIHIKYDGTGGISHHRELAYPHEAFSKIGEDRHEHRESVVHVALSNFDAHLDVSALARLQIVLVLIARHLCAVDPLAEKPIEASIFLEIHLLGHVFFSDGLERFSARGFVAMALDEIVHHVDERLVFIA